MEFGWVVIKNEPESAEYVSLVLSLTKSKWYEVEIWEVIHSKACGGMVAIRDYEKLLTYPFSYVSATCKLLKYNVKDGYYDR